MFICFFFCQNKSFTRNIEKRYKKNALIPSYRSQKSPLIDKFEKVNEKKKEKKNCLRCAVPKEEKGNQNKNCWLWNFAISTNLPFSRYSLLSHLHHQKVDNFAIFFIIAAIVMMHQVSLQFYFGCSAMQHGSSKTKIWNTQASRRGAPPPPY